MIFAFMLVILIGAAAFVVDLAWIWSNQLQVQRAADAGALAGVVRLPAEPAAAVTAARAETRKNGYTHLVDGVTVDAHQDPGFARRMVVSVSAPVHTFFIGIFGWDEVTVARTARAEYVLPVPMGSPQNYYGVGVYRDEVTNTTTSTSPASGDTDWNCPRASVSGGQWSNPNNANTTSSSSTCNSSSDNNQFASEDTNNEAHSWHQFGLQTEIANATGADSGSVVISEIEVRLRDVQLQGSGSSTSGCRVRAELSWNGGSNWSSPIDETPTTSASNLIAGDTSPASTSPWGGHTWALSELSDTNFRVRLTWREQSGCSSTRSVRLDALEVRVTYRYTQTTTTTTTSVEIVEIDGPHGEDLVPQNFWASVGSQGWPTTRGDPYLSYYYLRTANLNAQFAPSRYYNYAIEMPAGGDIYVFDPGFCDTNGSIGTSESWVDSGTDGNGSNSPVSTQFNLFRDTAGTPYNFGDDQYVAGSGNTFRRSDCEHGGSDPAWHNDWYRINSATLTAGTYRLNTTNRIFTDASAAQATWDTSDNQLNTGAGNYFAIWTNAGGRIYGLGAMSAQFQLDSSVDSTFYLAQIEAIHAGKWIDIDLWDIGDGCGAGCTLQIRAPGATNYTPIEFHYRQAPVGPTIAGNFSCGVSDPATTTLTAPGGWGENRWSRICLRIPDDYVAPHPSSDTVTAEGGWWKIRYSAPDGSSDVTTWQVTVRGNPVHLITPGDDTPTP